MSVVEPSTKSLLEKQEKLSNFQMYANLTSCTFQTVFGYICLDICVAISLHYIAEYGTIANAGYGFAYTCQSILITPFGFGLNQSLNMHAAQAIGDKKIPLSKRYLTLNFYLMIITIVPICCILMALKVPLKLIITENADETSDYAWRYLMYFLPATLLALELECVKTYMIAHKITYPFTIIHLCTTFVHWFLTWLFIKQLGWGMDGAGLAILITESCNIIGLMMFIFFTNLKNTIFSGVSLLLDFQRMRKLATSYIKTTSPIVLHLYSEFFVFFLLSFIAINLGTDQMNAHLGIQNTSGILFRFPISLSLALVSFVGTEMGKGDIKAAQKYVAAGLIILAISDILIVGLLILLKEQWANFYSADNEIVKNLLYDLFPWMVYGIVLVDGCQGTVNGALKGINQINLVFYSTLIAYYIICIPIVFYFTYGWGLDQGVCGIWMAFGLSNLLLLILYVACLFVTDWRKESNNIIERVQRQDKLNNSYIEVGEAK